MDVLAVVLPAFVIIALGWLSGRLGLFSHASVRPLSDYAFYLALPALTFLGLAAADLPALVATGVLNVAVATCVVVLVGVRLALHRFKLSRKTRAGVLVYSFLGNTAYLGIPVSILAAGAQGGSLAIVLSAAYFIVGMTVGVALIERAVLKRPRWVLIVRDLAQFPITWAIVFGVAFSLSGLQLPIVLTESLDLLAASALAVPLFALGVFVFGSDLSRDLRPALAVSAVKLVAMPLAALAFALALGLSGVLLKVSVIEAGVPVAVTSFVLAEKYGLAEGLAAESVVVSTAASVFTLGAIAAFL